MISDELVLQKSR